ncbi:hypothetical protein CPB85DRAFT_1443884 [Mucidula mucida]|nr:hypothetical protein CPB85DRAFT_1443884 [Mucidula mucida]
MDENYHHVGNGIACRYYNHGNCNKGLGCDYCHAPDVRSVRDSCGRNVCLHFLQGWCQFGEYVCHYSHDRSYLPENLAFPENISGPPPPVHRHLTLRASPVILDIPLPPAPAFLPPSPVVAVVAAPAYNPKAEKRRRNKTRQQGKAAAANATLRKVSSLSGKAAKTILKKEVKKEALDDISLSPLAESPARRLEYWDEDEFDRQQQEQRERDENGGYLKHEVEDLWAQGVKPWDDDAGAVLNVLNGYF